MYIVYTCIYMYCMYIELRMRTYICTCTHTFVHMNALLVEHYSVLILLKIDAESSLAAGTHTCRWLLTFKHGSLGHGSDNAIYTCDIYM